MSVKTILFILLTTFSSFVVNAEIEAEAMLAMEKSTVYIICKNNTSVGTGTGYMVSANQYIVTNWHVVACSSEGGQVYAMVNHQPILSEVIYHSSIPDLAIVKLPMAIDKPNVKFQLNIGKGNETFALGFPGRANSNGDQFEVKVTKGVISAVRGASTSGAASYYQTDAALNPGNSGGPLFDKHGHVVATNVMKSLIEIELPNGEKKRIPYGEGIAWAIQAKNVISMLDENNISYELAPPPNSFVLKTFIKNNFLLIMIFISIVLVTSFMVIKLKKLDRKKNFNEDIHTIRKDPKTPLDNPLENYIESGALQYRAFLIGEKGEFVGNEIELNNEPLVIGRDPRLANLIVSSKIHPAVSKKHCIVNYSKSNGQLELIDSWSTHGVKVNGSIIMADVAKRLKDGDKFSVTDELVFSVKLSE